MLSFDDVIERTPLIHNDRTRTWAIHHDLARFLDGWVGSETVVLEIGAGLSTLVILRKRPRLHISVQPNADEFAVIAEFAREHEIDTHAFRGVVARSQDYLPTADVPPLDLVLIDGDHSFPAPFVDWYYTADRLKVGGLMIVDDIHVGTGTILNAFMEADPKWEQVIVQRERFAVYRKRVELIHLGDWVSQPFLHDAHPTTAVRLIQSSGSLPLAEETPPEVMPAEALQVTQKLLEAVRVERDQAVATARHAVERIAAMESTKFWKLRRAWFHLRRLVGVSGDE